MYQWTVVDYLFMVFGLYILWVHIYIFQVIIGFITYKITNMK